MNYYNAVLLPPEKTSKEIINFAKTHYADIADGYCLSDDVLPHITLCQFKNNIMLDLNYTQTIDTPIFSQTNIRSGEGIHAGYDWIELLVKKEESLTRLAANVKDEITSLGGEVLTKKYNPHLTLCRFQSERVKEIEFPFDIFNDKDKWKFSVGKSDMNGQFYG